MLLNKTNKFLLLGIFYQFLLLTKVNCGNVSKNETSQENSTSNETISTRLLDDDDEFPMETQSAQCTITAGEVRASAQASTSKKLEGVCGSREMRKSFETLEAKLLQELYQLKLMIAQLQYPNINIAGNYINNQWGYPIFPNQNTGTPNLYPPGISNYNFNPTTTPAPAQTSTTTESTWHISSTTPVNKDFLFPSDTNIDEVSSKPFNFHPIEISSPSNNRFGEDTENYQTTTTTSHGLAMKSMESKPIKMKPKMNNGPRDFEVHRFNNTIISNDDTQIFTYFWKIENLSKKIQINMTEVLSPVFTISGLHLRVRAILNHLNRDYLYLKMESIPHDKILNSPNIILQSGNIFKEIETKKLFRHKIIILDQNSKVQTDMISQEFFNTNSGFMIPTSAITSSSYSKDDSILIKVIIYL